MKGDSAEFVQKLNFAEMSGLTSKFDKVTHAQQNKVYPSSFLILHIMTWSDFTDFRDVDTYKQQQLAQLLTKRFSYNSEDCFSTAVWVCKLESCLCGWTSNRPTWDECRDETMLLRVSGRNRCSRKQVCQLNEIEMRDTREQFCIVILQGWGTQHRWPFIVSEHHIKSGDWSHWQTDRKHVPTTWKCKSWILSIWGRPEHGQKHVNIKFDLHLDLVFDLLLICFGSLVDSLYSADRQTHVTYKSGVEACNFCCCSTWASRRA